VKCLAIQEWTSLIVTEPQFNIQQPTVAIAVNSVDMVIFGGSKDSVYTYNILENPGASTAVVKLMKNSSLR